jgi:hypothetical protein
MKDDYQQPVPHLLRGTKDDRRRAQHKKPKLHEQGTAEKLRGRVTKASGALPFDKGDVSNVEAHIFEFLVECKRTEKLSLGLKASWLDKITREARTRAGRTPALALQFEHVTDAEADWVAVPRSTFVRMLEMLGADAGKLGL